MPKWSLLGTRCISVHRRPLPLGIGGTWAMYTLALCIQGSISRKQTKCMLYCIGCSPCRPLWGGIAWHRTCNNYGFAFLWALAANYPRLRRVASCRLRKLPGKLFQTQRKLACHACRKRRLQIRAPCIYLFPPGRASTCCLAVHSTSYPLPRFS